MSHKENKSHEEKASGFKKNDLILVLLVFVAAGIFFAGHLFTSQKSAGVVEIQIDGKVVETLDLQKERAFKINGESIICLPNKIVLKIVDGEEAELDAVTN